MIRLTTNSFSWHPTYNQNTPELSGEEICRQARTCGAEGIEIDPSRVTARILADIGIALSGASTGGPLFDDWSEEDADKVVAAAAGVRELGGDYVFFTAAPKGGWGQDVPVTDDNLRLAGDRLNALAGRVRAEGIAIGLHNHAATPQGLAAEVALISQHTDPSLVGLYLDVAWAFCADGEPLQLIADLGPRCMGFHLRNHTADKVPTEGLLGGELDIAAIIAAIVGMGYDGWVGLELWHRQDVPVTRTMVECQEEAVGYLRSLLP